MSSGMGKVVEVLFVGSRETLEISRDQGGRRDVWGLVRPIFPRSDTRPFFRPDPGLSVTSSTVGEQR